MKRIGIVSDLKIWGTVLIPYLKDLINRHTNIKDWVITEKTFYNKDLGIEVKHFTPRINDIKGFYGDTLIYHPYALWDIHLADLHFRTDKLMRLDDLETIEREIIHYVKINKKEITETRKSSGF